MMRKNSVSKLKRSCRAISRPEGLKVNGTLKKGYKYVKGGKIVKAITAKKKK